MKRFAVYGAVLAALLLFPAGKTDVGQLIPVELLYLYEDSAGVHVLADTGDMGTGKTLDSALEDMKVSASGEIFLETTDYLVIAPNAKHLLPKLRHRLRPATQVCEGSWGGAETAAFLAAHRPEMELKDIRSGAAQLPILTRAEGRYHLAKSE